MYDRNDLSVNEEEERANLCHEMFPFETVFDIYVFRLLDFVIKCINVPMPKLITE